MINFFEDFLKTVLLCTTCSSYNEPKATLHKLDMVLLFKQYNLLNVMGAIGFKHVPMKIFYIFMFK